MLLTDRCRGLGASVNDRGFWKRPATLYLWRGTRRRELVSGPVFFVVEVAVRSVKSVSDFLIETERGELLVGSEIGRVAADLTRPKVV